MTDKEFKRLNRAQLIDIIYQLQLQVDQLTAQNRSLEKALADKRLCIDNAGSIAEAALVLNDCFRTAQNAADLYLSEIKAIRDETEAQRQRILAEAQTEVSAIVAKTRKALGDYDSAMEEMLKEYGKR
jgi:tRNA A37 threonylcarbamoyltransferase TsaD